MASCLKWTCSELEPGVCAEWDTQSARINSVSCPSGQCSLIDLRIQRGWKATGRTYCRDQPAKAIPPVNCEVVDESKAHTVNHPIPCRDKSDCIHQDGTASACKCALDGQSYCALSEGDEELGFYRTYCSGLDEWTGFNWYFFMGCFQELIALPTCAKTVFYEMDALCGILNTDSFGPELTTKFQSLAPDVCLP